MSIQTTDKKKHTQWKCVISFLFIIAAVIFITSSITAYSYIYQDKNNVSTPQRSCKLPECYLENEDEGIFARATGNPQCWMPPSCFRSSSRCLMYISQGGMGDLCAVNHAIVNTTDNSVHYKCEYTYHPPTPRPTHPTPPPSPPTVPSGTAINVNVFQAAETYDGSKRRLMDKTSMETPETSIQPTLAPTGNCSIPFCYYDQPGIFARKVGNPKCWKPPTCFRSTSSCLMYIPSGGIGDLCAVNHRIVNTTDNSVHYKCEYTYHPPTPRPTPPTPPPNPPSTPPGSDINMNVFQAAETYDNK